MNPGWNRLCSTRLSLRSPPWRPPRLSKVDPRPVQGHLCEPSGSAGSRGAVLALTGNPRPGFKRDQLDAVPSAPMPGEWSRSRHSLTNFFRSFRILLRVENNCRHAAALATGERSMKSMLFVSALVLSLTACGAEPVQLAQSAQSVSGDKITICHHTHSATNPMVTITVSANAWKAHVRHGDSVGECGGGACGDVGVDCNDTDLQCCSGLVCESGECRQER